MKWAVLLFALALAGCASKIIEHQPTPISNEQARSVIEQVLMEQPQKTRPEQVVFTSEYIAYGNGVISESNSISSAIPIGNGAFAAGSSTTSSKSIQTRIYFTSIGSVTLYSKRSHWVVITRNRAGSVLNSSLIDEQAKAERFVDSMWHFRKG